MGSAGPLKHVSWLRQRAPSKAILLLSGDPLAKSDRFLAGSVVALLDVCILRNTAEAGDL